jgi:hypothetical protein
MDSEGKALWDSLAEGAITEGSGEELCASAVDVATPLTSADDDSTRVDRPDGDGHKV